MILYTIVPHDQIFPTDQAVYSAQKLIEYNGIPVLVEQEEDHSFRIVKVVSSDPNHFLREDCCPGTKISFFSSGS
ncbi:YlzJ-like protein [Bacillus oleivorans]|uniref:YlzJ-like protein n=1 Tax=Bacillus oleivorans TaxID=1448271 RepID=A0A285D6U2_9BACI|nr:YlzJ-like family protein [Bacillus oleivorans]SNX75355.1 YlzJ-like protein [Bacillus oleivorans]